MLTLKTGFASKMKAISHDLYGWAGLEDEEYYEIHPELKDITLPTIGKTPRQVWIELGTTVGRAIYKQTWIMFVMHRKCDYLVIKDVRFPDEGEEILKRGGRVFRVDNPRIKPTDDKADCQLANWQHWSGILVNDSDLNTLYRRTIELVGDYINIP